MTTLRLALIAVGGTLVYLGLAVLRPGGFHSALIVVAAATIAMAVVGLFSSGNVNPNEREDRANRWVLAACAVIGLLNAYLPAYTDRRAIWTVDGEAMRRVGVAAALS